LLWQNLNFTSYSWGVVKEELFAAIAS